MKKFISLILALSLLLAFAACEKEADDITDNNDITISHDDGIQEQISDVQDIIGDVVEENVQSNIGSYETPAESDFGFESVEGGVKIVSYTGTATAINVPETLGGNSVVEIGEAAFNDIGVVAIKLPDTLIKVNENAFYYCTTLNEVELGENTTEVSKRAFMGCLALHKVIFNEKLKAIGEEAFSTCSSLTEISFPTSLETIGGGAFVLSGIKSVVIPDSVASIERSAFSYCDNLSEVVIGNGIKSLNESVFEACSSLEKIVIPASVTEIDISALQQCPNLTICAPAGSVAETFAATYEINFQAI